MATAFTRQERECIYESLQRAALHCAATVGMKHTTVDELAREAGISKGAFYSFFESKELLFLSMVERLHDEMYGSAEKVFEARSDLPMRQRAMLAIYELCRVAQKYDIIAFMREELPLLLRRLSDSALHEHYVSDDERIKGFLQKSGAALKTTPDVACATVHVLLMALSLKGDVGKGFDEAIKLMIEGACDKVFA